MFRVIFETGTLGRKRNISAATGETTKIFFKESFNKIPFFLYSGARWIECFQQLPKRKKERN